MSGVGNPQPSAAAGSEPASTPAAPRSVISAERTARLISLDRSGRFDARRSGDLPEQTPTSAASDSFEPAAQPVSAEQTSSSESTDSFVAPLRPVPTPRPTPRAAWIGTTHARRLLDIGSENTIKNW